MITKDTIKKQEQEILTSLGKLYNGLEVLWDAARNRDYNKVTRIVDNLQNFGDDCVSHVKFNVEMLAHYAYELIEIIDKREGARVADEATRILDAIKNRLDFWEKRRAELASYQSAGLFEDEDKG